MSKNFKDITLEEFIDEKIEDENYAQKMELFANMLFEFGLTEFPNTRNETDEEDSY